MIIPVCLQVTSILQPEPSHEYLTVSLEAEDVDERGECSVEVPLCLVLFFKRFYKRNKDKNLCKEYLHPFPFVVNGNGLFLTP
ncbi:hypothetical protein CLAVI_000399 [Candidatus Clavichlamydia salmonicola]|nr:hypothetical protein [Candidatus Clavichlamydia salmonicola]